MSSRVETRPSNLVPGAGGGPGQGGPRDAALFFRRWLAHPLRMGSIVPSSPALTGRVARLAIAHAGDDCVLELGAGTGVVSRALLAAGLPAERLIANEIEPDMVRQLREDLPGATVMDGDARRLPEVLPELFRGRIGAVICGIPLVMLPKPEQARFIGAMQAVAPGRGFFHYSYCITSPLPREHHGLTGVRRAWTPMNFPPASVWHYAPA
jgi:phosphatidylethanolamine/phosphatidyl-N-methylethanolamine N-methyltransferase